MQEQCSMCKKWYYPHSDHQKIKVCSENCRGKHYHNNHNLKLILKGKYHNLSVRKIEKLGFRVLVEKI